MPTYSSYEKKALVLLYLIVQQSNTNLLLLLKPSLGKSPSFYNQYDINWEDKCGFVLLLILPTTPIASSTVPQKQNKRGGSMLFQDLIHEGCSGIIFWKVLTPQVMV